MIISAEATLLDLGLPETAVKKELYWPKGKEPRGAADECGLADPGTEQRALDAAFVRPSQQRDDRTRVAVAVHDHGSREPVARDACWSIADEHSPLGIGLVARERAGPHLESQISPLRDRRPDGRLQFVSTVLVVDAYPIRERTLEGRFGLERWAN